MGMGQGCADSLDDGEVAVMRFLSVCSGIEAASVAWNPLGWKAHAFSEIEPFPCAVLAHHYPDTPNWGDMTQYKEWPDVSIDLLCGGTPCQSFSVAGLRKGLDDPRGDLMLTYGAIAAKYRPKWLVWENVPGVLSSNGGRDFGTFLGMLGQLGYGFAYRVLDAQYFGVAQRRRRVFVVGCLGDWRSAAAVLFERHSLQGNPAPRRQAGKVAPTIPSRSTAGGGLGTDFDLDGGTICVATGQAGAEIGADMAPTLNCNHEAPYVVGALACNTGPNGHDAGNFACNQAVDAGHIIAHSLRGEGFDASEDGTGRGTPLVPMSVALRGRDGGATAELGDDLAFSLRASSGGGDKPHVMAFAQNQRDEVRLMDIAGALTAEPGTKHQTYAQVGMQVRRLTPTECERLQGFPDEYTQVPHRNKPAADGPRYKALGNSWAVPVAHWIGRRIDAVEAIHAQKAREAA
jgi:DNA (cytosine-5)-methyltransferase 1